MAAIPIWKCDVKVGYVLHLPRDADTRDPAAFSASKLSEQGLNHPVIIVDLLDDNPEMVEKVKIVKCTSVNFKHGYDDLRIAHYDDRGMPTQCAQCKEAHTTKAKDMLTHKNRSIQMKKPTHVKTDEKHVVSLLMLRAFSRQDGLGLYALDERSVTLLKKKAGIVPTSRSASPGNINIPAQPAEKRTSSINVDGAVEGGAHLRSASPNRSANRPDVRGPQIPLVSGSEVVSAVAKLSPQSEAPGGGSPGSDTSVLASPSGSLDSETSPKRNSLRKGSIDSVSDELKVGLSRRYRSGPRKTRSLEDKTKPIRSLPKTLSLGRSEEPDVTAEPTHPSPIIEIPACQAGSIYRFSLDTCRFLAAKYGQQIPPSNYLMSNQKFIFQAMMPDQRAVFFRVSHIAFTQTQD